MVSEILTISILLFAQLFAIALIVVVAVDGWKKVISDKNSAKVALFFSAAVLLVTGVGILQAFQLPLFTPAFLLFFLPLETVQLVLGFLYFLVDWFITSYIVCQGTSGLYKILKKYQAYKTALENVQKPPENTV